jgi:hypothetical protein
LSSESEVNDEPTELLGVDIVKLESEPKEFLYFFLQGVLSLPLPLVLVNGEIVSRH